MVLTINIFKLCTVVNGPGGMCFFGDSIIQQDYLSCMIDCSDKSNSLEGYRINRICVSQANKRLNNIELLELKS